METPWQGCSKHTGICRRTNSESSPGKSFPGASIARKARLERYVMVVLITVGLATPILTFVSSVHPMSLFARFFRAPNEIHEHGRLRVQKPLYLRSSFP